MPPTSTEPDTQRFRIALGEHIAHQREQRRLTRGAIVRRMPISHVHLTAVEEGRRGISMATLHRLARAIGCDVTAFFPELWEWW